MQIVPDLILHQTATKCRYIQLFEHSIMLRQYDMIRMITHFAATCALSNVCVWLWETTIQTQYCTTRTGVKRQTW